MTTLQVPYRRIFGYDPEDLGGPPLVNWTGRRVARDDAPRGNMHRAYALNTSVMESEMSARARRAYGRIDLPEGVDEAERKWGIPTGTYLALGAQRSRRANR